MGKNIIRELLVRLGIDVDPKTKQDVAKFNKQIEEVKESLQDLAGYAWDASKALAGMVVAGATAAGVLAVQTGQHAEQIERQARALNLTTTEYQELQHVFGTFGADAGEIADAFAQLTEKAVDASSGAQTVADEWGLLGIRVDQLKGKRPNELFLLLADAVGKATDRQKALAAVSKLLGEDSAKKLLPVLAQGAGAVQALAQEAHDLGVVMGDDQLRASEEAARGWRSLTTAAQGLKNMVGAKLAPTVGLLLRQWTEWIRSNREVIGQRVDRSVDLVYGALYRLNQMVHLIGGWDVVLTNVATGAGMLYLIANLDKVEKALKAVRLGTTLLSAGLDVVMFQMGVAFWPVTLGVGALTIALGLLYLAYDDVATYLRGGESVLGRHIEIVSEAARGFVEFADSVLSYIPGYASFKDMIVALGEAFAALPRIARRLGTALTEGLAPAWAIVDLAMQPVKTLLEAIGLEIEDIEKLAAKLWKNLDKIAGSPFATVAAGLRGVTAGAEGASAAAAGQIQAEVAGRVQQGVATAAGVSQTVDTSVRQVTQTNNFYGDGAGDVGRHLDASMRKARLGVSGGVR